MLRRDFTIDGTSGLEGRWFFLQLQTPSERAAVRLNGVNIPLKAATEKDKGVEWNYQAIVTMEASAVDPLAADEHIVPVLRYGRNKLRIGLRPEKAGDDVLLDVGIYAVSRPQVSGLAGVDVKQELEAAKASR